MLGFVLIASTDLASPQVDVYIFEPKGISVVETPNSLGEQFAQMIKLTKTKDKVKSTY